MSSYSCPDCKDGTLEAQVRELELELADGESIELIDGRVYATSIRCDNGCSDAAPPPRKVRRRDLRRERLRQVARPRRTPPEKPRSQ